MVKVKQVLTPPQQASPYVLNLPQPPVRNAEEYLKAYIGYVYAAVGAIAQEVASIDLHLFQVAYKNGKPTTKEIYEHPLLSVLNYVNSLSTRYELIEATQTYLELTGECFWVVLQDTSGPKEIWLLRPDWVKVIPSATEVIDHYNYYAGGVITEKVEIPRQFVVPFKYFHPMNPYRGKGATQAAALPFDILNFAQEYNRNFFFNSAIPSMVFSTEQKISETTVKRFLEQWQSSFGGRSKSNKVAFLGNGMKLDKASFSNKELDFGTQMPLMRDDVLAVFKVPKTIIGSTDGVNMANANATTKFFKQGVITPKDRKFVETLNEFLLPMFVGQDDSLFLDFTDPAPEEVEIKLQRYASGLGTGGAKPWMTQNEVRAEENLPPLPGGDDIMPTTTPALGATPQNSPESTSPVEAPNETPDDQNPDQPVEESVSLVQQVLKRVGLKSKEIKAYSPPTYLKTLKPFKHMVNLPTKRPNKIYQEKLAAQFVPVLRKMIGDLFSQDDYSPLKKSNTSELTEKEKELKTIIAESIKETITKEEESPKERSSGWSVEQKTAYWKAFIQHVTKREGQIEDKCIELFDEQKKLVLERLDDQTRSWRKRLGIKATAASVVPSLEDLSKMWKVLENILREIYIEQGNYTMDFLGVGGNINITTAFATQYLLEYGGQLIKQINESTRSQLMSSLAEGFEAGESVDTLSKRVEDIFENANSVRAHMIAHTEALRASNTASVEAYRQSGVVSGKEWLAEQDGHTCPLCEDQDGKVVDLDDNYFEKGDSKTVGGETFNFDYTSIGEPPGHVDCRCTTIPVLINT